MKMYATVEIKKGWDTWNEMAEDLNSDMVSVAGMQFIYKGCDMDEKKVHMILEFESMEKGGEWLTRPDILQKRIEAGADVESTVIIPLKDGTPESLCVYLFINKITDKQLRLML